MKILPGAQPATPIAEATENQAAQPASPQLRKKAEHPVKGDHVDFSAPLAQTLKSQQEQQSERVASIKASIKAGTYQVSSRDVAEKMLSNSSDFSTPRS